MTVRGGILRTLHARVAPFGVGLGGLVLMGFLALGAAHEHSDDPPGAPAIHCVVVAGPLAAAGHASEVQACPDPIVVRVDPSAPGILTDQAPVTSSRARGPPSSTRKV